MGNEVYRKEIEDARSAADESLYFLERVGEYLESASAKGLLDFLASKNENLEEAQKQLLEAKMKVTQLKMKLNQL